MKNAVKHTVKLTKGERLGWTAVKRKAEVRLTSKMVHGRPVNVQAVSPANTVRNLLVP